MNELPDRPADDLEPPPGSDQPPAPDESESFGAAETWYGPPGVPEPLPLDMPDDLPGVPGAPDDWDVPASAVPEPLPLNATDDFPGVPGPTDTWDVPAASVPEPFAMDEVNQAGPAPEEPATFSDWPAPVPEPSIDPPVPVLEHAPSESVELTPLSLEDEFVREAGLPVGELAAGMPALDAEELSPKAELPPASLELASGPLLAQPDAPADVRHETGEAYAVAVAAAFEPPPPAAPPPAQPAVELPTSALPLATPPVPPVPAWPAAGQPVANTIDERTLAALAHASGVLYLVLGGWGGIVAALAIWLTQKDRSPWVGFHALQSALFQLAELFITVGLVGATIFITLICAVLTFGFGALFTFPVVILVTMATLVMTFGGLAYQLYGAYQVYQGRAFRYPWIADLIERQTPGGVPGPSGAAVDRVAIQRIGIALVGVIVAFFLCICLLGFLGAVFGLMASSGGPGFRPVPVPGR